MCETPLDDWTNGGSVDVFLSIVLALWGFKDKIMLQPWQIAVSLFYIGKILPTQNNFSSMVKI